MTKYSVLAAGNNRYGNIIKNCFTKIQTAKLKATCTAGVKSWKGEPGGGGGGGGGGERKKRVPL